MIVQCVVSCNNSPKKLLLKDWTIAFVKKDKDFVLQHLLDDVNWHLVGNQSIVGIEAFKKLLDDIVTQTPKTLQIDYIITHGNVGSVNGILHFGDEVLHFCHVFKFNGHGKKAKICEITSYIIR